MRWAIVLCTPRVLQRSPASARRGGLHRQRRASDAGDRRLRRRLAARCARRSTTPTQHRPGRDRLRRRADGHARDGAARARPPTWSSTARTATGCTGTREDVAIDGNGAAFDGLVLGPGSDGSRICGLNIQSFADGLRDELERQHDRRQPDRHRPPRSELGTDTTNSSDGIELVIGGDDNTITGNSCLGQHDSRHPDLQHLHRQRHRRQHDRDRRGSGEPGGPQPGRAGRSSTGGIHASWRHGRRRHERRSAATAAAASTSINGDGRTGTTHRDGDSEQAVPNGINGVIVDGPLGGRRGRRRGRRNLISGNTGPGVFMVQPGTVSGNWIGPTQSGTLPPTTRSWSTSAGGRITDNVIAGHSHYGVASREPWPGSRSRQPDRRDAGRDDRRRRRTGIDLDDTRRHEIEDNTIAATVARIEVAVPARTISGTRSGATRPGNATDDAENDEAIDVIVPADDTIITGNRLSNSNDFGGVQIWSGSRPRGERCKRAVRGVFSGATGGSADPSRATMIGPRRRHPLTGDLVDRPQQRARQRHGRRPPGIDSPDGVTGMTPRTAARTSRCSPRRRSTVGAPLSPGPSTPPRATTSRSRSSRATLAIPSGHGEGEQFLGRDQVVDGQRGHGVRVLGRAATSARQGDHRDRDRRGRRRSDLRVLRVLHRDAAATGRRSRRVGDAAARRSDAARRHRVPFCRRSW